MKSIKHNKEGIVKQAKTAREAMRSNAANDLTDDLGGKLVEGTDSSDSEQEDEHDGGALSLRLTWSLLSTSGPWKYM